MSQADPIQTRIAEKLSEHFSEVEKEWRITKNATDSFSINIDVYAPRLDVAVGPFNTDEPHKEENVEKIQKTFSQKATKELKNIVELKRLEQNQNPRCMLAIEVAFSGSEKHFLGDITNASMMGLYGFVVANNSTLDKLERIFRYAKVAKQVGKMPVNLFSNVCIISDEKFLQLL